MKNVIVALAAGVLLLAFLFPEGVAPQPVTPDPATPVAPAVPVDAGVQQALAGASAADRNRIVGVYDALAAVLTRDGGKRINTTEKWAEFQANTLQLAIDTPGKYPGLDVAIENVFKTTVGTDDVLPTNEATREKLVNACAIIAASAK